MAPEDQFYTLLLCLRHLDINYIKNLESNILRRCTNLSLADNILSKDDNHKLVNFNGETIGCACQLNKLK